MKNKLQNSDGFTLIELMTVIAIVGVLSGIAVMSASNMYASYQLRAMARMVFSDMQYARLVAIKQGKETIIDWGKDASGDVYYSPKWKVGGGKLPKLDTIIYLTGVKSRYKRIKACHPTNPGDDPTDVEFNPNGTATTGGIKLSLDDKVYRIYISSAGTGNVRILNKADLLDQFPDDADECP